MTYNCLHRIVANVNDPLIRSNLNKECFDISLRTAFSDCSKLSSFQPFIPFVFCFGNLNIFHPQYLIGIRCRFGGLLFQELLLTNT